MNCVSELHFLWLFSVESVKTLVLLGLTRGLGAAVMALGKRNYSVPNEWEIAFDEVVILIDFAPEKHVTVRKSDCEWWEWVMWYDFLCDAVNEECSPCCFVFADDPRPPKRILWYLGQYLTGCNFHPLLVEVKLWIT